MSARELRVGRNIAVLLIVTFGLLLIAAEALEILLKRLGFFLWLIFAAVFLVFMVQQVLAQFRKLPKTKPLKKWR